MSAILRTVRRLCGQLSVDIDRFDDVYLRKYLCKGLSLGGKPATPKILRAACADLRQRGQEVFPCEHDLDARGYCQGEEIPYVAADAGGLHQLEVS
jgi:hypothetical protein